VIKADALPFIQSGDYWIVRFRGRWHRDDVKL